MLIRMIDGLSIIDYPNPIKVRVRMFRVLTDSWLL